MTILTVVLVFILVAILLVAAELYVLIRELGRLVPRIGGEREAHEVPSAGQTITVNLSSMPPTGQSVVVSDGKASASDVTRGERASNAEKETPGNESAPLQQAAKKSGSFAVECPRCHAENSSYRVECFNCGNPL